jgi:hypothetical protein
MREPGSSDIGEITEDLRRDGNVSYGLQGFRTQSDASLIPSAAPAAKLKFVNRTIGRYIQMESTFERATKTRERS